MAGPADPAVASSPSWPRLVLVGLRTFYLSVLVWLVVWTGAAIVLLGLDPLLITSGSMSPGIRPGDVVLTAAPHPDRLEPGRVVTFVDPGDPTRLVTHRIDSVLEDGRLRTRGDANAAPDSTPVDVDAVVGEGRLLVSLLGLPLLWLRTGQYALFGLWAVLTLGALLAPGAGRTRPTPAPAAAAPGARLRETPERPMPTPPAPVSVPPPLPNPTSVHLWHARQPPSAVHAARASHPPPRRTPAPAAARVLTVLGVVSLAVVVPTATAQAWSRTTASPGSAWTAAAMTAPTGLAATGGCQLVLVGPKVDLSWSAAPGSGYEILRSTTAGGPYGTVGTVAGAGTTSFTDTSVAIATTYHYVVRATAGTWASSPSAEASATTPALCL